MRKRLSFVLAIILAVGAYLPSRGIASSQESGPAKAEMRYVPGELVIGFYSEPDAATFQDPSISLIEEVTPRFIEGISPQSLRRAAVQPAYRVHVEDSDDVETAAARLRQDPRIRFAEPNYIYICETSDTAFPDDPMVSDQWGLVDANVITVLNEQGVAANTEVTVAVIDTGTDRNHPDLQGRVLDGFNAITDTNDPADDNGHGTRVSGIIAANSGNAVGITGIARNASILPVKFLDRGGRGTSANAAKAINWGVAEIKRRGTPGVINASWGGPEAQVIADAVKAANDAGILFVAAAGNEGEDDTEFPASIALPNVISAAAHDIAENRATFSNIGAISAPGVGILSTLPGGNYGKANGTSFAAPHVAGAAAVLLGSDPDPGHAKHAILASAEEAPGLQGGSRAGGKLNLSRAVHGEFNPPAEPRAFAKTGYFQKVSIPVRFDASLSYDPHGSRLTYYWDFDDGTTATTQEPVVEHMFQLAGELHPQLVVKNEAGLFSKPEVLDVPIAPAITIKKVLYYRSTETLVVKAKVEGMGPGVQVRAVIYDPDKFVYGDLVLDPSSGLYILKAKGPKPGDLVWVESNIFGGGVAKHRKLRD